MRSKSLLTAAVCGLATFVPAAVAHAGVFTFSGSATATASVAPDPTCAPYPFRGTILPANSAGASNLGSFTYAHNVCTQGAVTPVSLQNGTFEIAFVNGTINGTFVGATTPDPNTPGLSNQMFDYTITGGSGAFAGAFGSFGNIGTVDTRNAPPSRLAFNFEGQINTPAVPEPATWALMIIGFGVLGASMRKREKLAPLTPTPSSA